MRVSLGWMHRNPRNQTQRGNAGESEGTMGDNKLLKECQHCEGRNIGCDVCEQVRITELETERDTARRERDIALKWYRVHEELCELLGCQLDCNPDFMLGVWRCEVENLVAENQRLREELAMSQAHAELAKRTLNSICKITKGTTDAPKT